MIALQAAMKSRNVNSYFTAGETLAVNDYVYIEMSSIAGRVYKTDADDTAKSSTAWGIGFVVTGATIGNPVEIRTEGVMSGFTSLTAGALYYASGTAGGVTAVKPANALLVGIAISTTEILINKRGFQTDTIAPVESNMIYWIGGVDGANLLTRIDKQATDSATSGIAAVCSVVRYFAASETMGNYQYTAGGADYYASIDKLTSDTVCGAIAAVLSETKSEMGAGVLSDIIYILGGWRGAKTDKIEKLTNDSTCALVAAVLATAQGGKSSDTMSAAIYTFGCYNTAANAIEKLTDDNTNAAITAVSSFNVRKSGVSDMAGKIYCCDGNDGAAAAQPTTTIQKLTNDTTISTVAAVLSAARNFVGAEKLGNTIRIAGSYVGNLSSIDKLSDDATCAVVTATLSGGNGLFDAAFKL